MFRRALLWLMLLAVACLAAGPAPAVRLSGLPVVVAPTASPAVKQQAQTLATYLGKITGQNVPVQTGDGRSGIAVGLASDFPAAGMNPPSDPLKREDYVLSTHPGGLYCVGASELGLQRAVWDLLYRAGYRQFFPGPDWEVIPRTPDLTLSLDLRAHPDYVAREIWYGWGEADWAKAPARDWRLKNRMGSAVELETGHAYEEILARNQKEFQQHPEYLALIGGRRTGDKFCISNPGLRKLVVADRLRWLKEHPNARCVSVEPSDGGDWCQCEPCSRLGSPSDRAVLLANEVIAALPPDIYAGMYAYNEHSPPPTRVKVSPRLIVSVATSFVKGGYTPEQLMQGWRAAGAQLLGVREYYSVIAWDKDLPGAAEVANLDYLKSTLPKFNKLGVRFFNSEAGDNWGPYGLGYYLASRALWDTKDAQRFPELTDDFLTRAFGPAKAPMAKFYQLIDGAKKPMLSDDTVGRMYRLLQEALSLAKEPGQRKRIEDLVLYTRYVELYMDYTEAGGAERQANFEKMMRHSYKIGPLMLVHALAQMRDMPDRDAAVKLPANLQPGQPYTEAQTLAFLQQGITRRKLLDFTPVSYSQNLVSAAPLHLAPQPLGDAGLFGRGDRTYYTWVQANQTLPVSGEAGLIYGNLGPALVSLYPSGDAKGEPSSSFTLVPDKVDRPLGLTSPYAGLARIVVQDNYDATLLKWPEGFPMTLWSDPEHPLEMFGRWTLYFYVPKGTRVIGGYSTASGELHNPEGTVAFNFSDNPEFFKVPVGPGQDGKLWKFNSCQGSRLLMTVPPCLARSPSELLLPAEVVRRDQ